MLKRWIVQIEWYPFLGHRLPRISIARAPYPGQVVYTKGWGWRKLLVCGVCSGNGYFDAPVNDPRTTLVTRYPDARLPGSTWPAEPRTDDRPSDYTDLPGERVSDGSDNDDWFASDDHGRVPEDLHYGCPDYPCHKFHDA